MGFGGETTLFGCKIGVMHRIPASFFVSVAYNCWAFRRLGVKVNPETGEINEWLYQEGEKIDFAREEQKQRKKQQQLQKDHVKLFIQAPITEEQIRELKVGDVVQINGRMYTGRDAIHKHLSDK